MFDQVIAKFIYLIASLRTILKSQLKTNGQIACRLSFRFALYCWCVPFTRFRWLCFLTPFGVVCSFLCLDLNHIHIN